MSTSGRARQRSGWDESTSCRHCICALPYYPTEPESRPPRSWRATFRSMPPLVHLAVAQIKPRKGDYRGNLERLKAVFAQVDQLSPRPNVLCLAESALTGYFLEGGV